jgi:hypothetical protein
MIPLFKHSFLALIISVLPFNDECEWYGKQLVITKEAMDQRCFSQCPGWEQADFITVGNDFLIEVCESRDITLIVDTLTGFTSIKGFFKVAPNSQKKEVIDVFMCQSETILLKQITRDSCWLSCEFHGGLNRLSRPSFIKPVLSDDTLNFMRSCELLKDKATFLDKLKNSNERLLFQTTFYIVTNPPVGKTGARNETYQFGIRIQFPLKYINKMVYHEVSW